MLVKAFALWYNKFYILRKIGAVLNGIAERHRSFTKKYKKKNLDAEAQVIDRPFFRRRIRNLAGKAEEESQVRNLSTLRTRLF